MVIDAGGGTIDISSYTVRVKSPLKVEELYLPKCEWSLPERVLNLNVQIGVYQGAEFVTARAREWARGKSKSMTLLPSYCISQLPAAKFKNSKFDSESDIDTFTECFDKGLKSIFWDESKAQFVKFGSAGDKDSRCDVKDGRAKLPGQAISACIHLRALRVLFYHI